MTSILEDMLAMKKLADEIKVPEKLRRPISEMDESVEEEEYDEWDYAGKCESDYDANGWK